MNWMYNQDDADAEISRIFAEADRIASRYDIGGGITAPETVDVIAIRRGMGLSRAAFAREIGVPLATVRKWEAGVRQPDAAARVLLSMVAADAGVVGRTLALLDLRTGHVTTSPGR